MRVRAYRDADVPGLSAAFRAAVRETGVAACPWAAPEASSALGHDEAAFGERLAQGITRVAETTSSTPAAFGEFDPGDRIAMLYAAPGPGRATCHPLEDRARRSGVRSLTTESSLVAKPFFEHRVSKSSSTRRCAATASRLSTRA